MKKFVCTVCGYIHEGETAPEVCPVCKVGAEKFEEMKGEMVWADEHRIGAAQGVDEEILEGFPVCFNRGIKLIPSIGWTVLYFLIPAISRMLG